MADGIYVAVSGSVAQLRRMETVSNNLANVNTPGFRRDEVTFAEVQAKLLDGADPNLPRNRDKRFVDPVGTHTRQEPGSLTQTDNPLDVALNGDGFIRVQTAMGERLTRNGRMLVDRSGTLRTLNGHAVLDDGGGEITLPPGTIPSISRLGEVSAEGVRVGRIGIAKAAPDAGMRKEGDGLFMPLGRVEEVDRESVDVLQGFVEESNVNPVKVMAELVEVQRTFEALHQVISAYRNLDDRATRLLR